MKMKSLRANDLIFLSTVSLHFTGTWAITGLMLLANLYLLCWDYHKLKTIIG